MARIFTQLKKHIKNIPGAIIDYGSWTYWIYLFIFFSRGILSESLMTAIYGLHLMAFSSEHPNWDQNPISFQEPLLLKKGLVWRYSYQNGWQYLSLKNSQKWKSPLLKERVIYSVWLYSSALASGRALSSTLVSVSTKGIEWSLGAFVSKRAVRLCLQTRAVINFFLRAANTLENTYGEKQELWKFRENRAIFKTRTRGKGENREVGEWSGNG